MEREMQPGDKVLSTKLGPGVWEVVEVYDLNVKITLNGVTHVRPKQWFLVTEASKKNND